MEDYILDVVDLDTGNKKITSRASSWSELFEAVATGLTGTMLNLDQIDLEFERELDLTGDDVSGLMYDFLTEILAMKENEGLVFSEFEVEVSEKDAKLTAKVRGEKLVPTKHHLEANISEISFDGFVVEFEEDPDEENGEVPYRAEVEVVVV